jgi:hypothetical protein
MKVDKRIRDFVVMAIYLANPVHLPALQTPGCRSATVFIPRLVPAAESW